MVMAYSQNYLLKLIYGHKRIPVQVRLVHIAPSPKTGYKSQETQLNST